MVDKRNLLGHPRHLAVYFGRRGTLGGLSLTVDGFKLAYARTKPLSSTEKSEVIILDMVTNEVQEVHEGAGCGDPSWSPDGSKMTLGCSDIKSGGVIVVTLSTGEISLVAVDSEVYSPRIGPGGASWTSDGQWISFFFGPNGRPGSDGGTCGSEGDGIYIVDTECLDAPDTCKPQVLLAGNEYSCYFAPSWWSPSGNYLALNSGTSGIGRLNLIDPWKKTFHEYDDNACGFTWSPGGQKFAVNFSGYYTDKDSDCSDIYIGSIDGSEPVIFQKGVGTVVGWIYKLTFDPGDVMSITPAGHDLNLRASPSLSTDVLRKLQPDDTVTILEGPVEADGYTWWKMKTNDGLEGWAVEVSVWYEPVSTATPTPTKSP